MRVRSAPYRSCWSSRLGVAAPASRRPAAGRAVSVVATGLDSPRHLAFGCARRPVRRRGRPRRQRAVLRRRRGPGVHGRQRRGDEDRPLGPPVPDRRWASPRSRTRPATRQRDRPARHHRRSARDTSIDHQRRARPSRTDRRPALTDPARDARPAQNPVADLFGRSCCSDHARTRRSRVADIWAFERDVNPDAAAGNPAVDSNPVDVLFDGGRLRRRRRRRQRARRASTSSAASRTSPCSRTGPVPNPFSRGHRRSTMQAVPTSVDEGPRPPVLRRPAHRLPVPGRRRERLPRRTRARAGRRVFASGFTNIMDLAFGRDGTLYVLEIDHDGLLGRVPTARSSPSTAGARGGSSCRRARCRSPAGSPSARTGSTSRPTPARRRRTGPAHPLMRTLDHPQRGLTPLRFVEGYDG